MPPVNPGLVAVTLNPAIDHTLDCPNFKIDAVNRVTADHRTPGGKGFSVASFIARRPIRVTATGFLGYDNAVLFENVFRAKGIADRCLRLPGATRVNVKITDHVAGTVTDINRPGLAIDADTMAQFEQSLEMLTTDNDWFVLAGSLTQGVPDDYYARLTEQLHRQGMKVAVDASGEALRHALTCKPDMIKPNVHELSAVLGRKLETTDDVVAAARELQKGGIGLVVVSMGARGAVFVDKDQALLAKPLPVEVVSTVGAGDAMVAGTLAGILMGEELSTCARQGTAFSAGTLGLIGPELPNDKKLADLMAQVEVEKIG